MYAATETCKIGMKTCFVTFHHKAVKMVSSGTTDGELSSVRLRGFHLLMSFMGTVGTIMVGSGLKEVWYII